MKIIVNGTATEVAATRLADALEELGHGGAKVATAVNEAFVPAPRRGDVTLSPGDRLEILAPRQGG